MKPATSILLAALFCVAFAGRSSANLAQGDQTEMALQAAMKKEAVDGDLKGAIEAYKKIAQSRNRTVAAEALVRMGQCYEKLGDTEARKAYERVVRDFGDQSEQAAQARTRLAALERSRAPSPSGLSVRQIPGDPFLALSADGRYASITDWSSGDVALRDLKTGENRRLTKTGNWAAQEGSDTNIVSPDGKLVAFNWCKFAKKEFEVRVVGTDGSRDRALFGKGPYVWPFAWSADSKSLVVAEASGDAGRLVAISIADGSERELVTFQGRPPSKGAFSPDGRYFAYSARPEKTVVAEEIYVLDLQAPPGGASATKLVEDPAFDKLMGWSPDGKYILFTSNRNGSPGAWLLPVQGGKAAGSPQLVKPHLAANVTDVSPAGFASNGSFYYALRQFPVDAQVATLDPTTGRVTGAPAVLTNRFTGGTCCARWSADGSRVLYLSPKWTILIRSADGGEERELLPQLAQMLGVRWAPDGQSLVATGHSRDKRAGVYRVDLNTGAASLLAAVDGPGWDAEISPDGGTVYFRSGVNRIVARNLTTGGEKIIHETEPGLGIGNIALSRDGRFLAVLYNNRLLIVPTAGGEERERVKLEPPQQGKFFGVDWTPDGKYVLATVSTGDSQGFDLWRLPVEGGEPQKTKLPRSDYFIRGSIHMHPDGRRLAITAGRQQWEVWAMENFLPKSNASR